MTSVSVTAASGRTAVAGQGQDIICYEQDSVATKRGEF